MLLYGCLIELFAVQPVVTKMRWMLRLSILIDLSTQIEKGFKSPALSSHLNNQCPWICYFYNLLLNEQLKDSFVALFAILNKQVDSFNLVFRFSFQSFPRSREGWFGF